MRMRSPREAAVRELEEQAGYRAGQLAELIRFQPMAGSADSERVVFVGRGAERVGAPVSSEGIERAEWVPLGLVPELIGAGQIWDSATLVGLLQVMAQERPSPADE
jgi:8-oxo-dGTP pyrophosphatase MutT (NUDIX family)